MANELGISPRTLSRKIKKSGLIISPGLLTIKDQKAIYKIFGIDYKPILIS